MEFLKNSKGCIDAFLIQPLISPIFQIADREEHDSRMNHAYVGLSNINSRNEGWYKRLELGIEFSSLKINMTR